MKNAIIAIITILIVAAIGFAGPGEMIRDNNGEAIQGFSGLPATVRTDSIAGTKAFKNISTTNYRAIRATCTDSATAGNPVNCRAQYNAAGPYVPILNGGRVFVLDKGVTTLRFGNYSTTSSTTVVLTTERM